MSSPGTDEKLTLRMSYHWPMVSIAKGEGTRNDWELVAAALNMAVVLAETGFRLDGDVETIKTAQQAAHTLRLRFKEKGRMVLTGEELGKINAALAIHDAQIESTDLTIKHIEQAITQVQQRIAAKEWITAG